MELLNAEGRRLFEERLKFADTYIIANPSSPPATSSASLFQNLRSSETQVFEGYRGSPF